MKRAYEKAFGPGSHIVKVGILQVPTGRVAACDPFFAGTTIPFEKKIAPGEYEVQVSLVELPDWGRRIAMARLLVHRDAVALSFERANMEHTDSNRYMVDAGLGSFMDEQTRQAFAELMARFYQARPDGNYYDDVLAAEFKLSAVDKDDPHDVGDWNMHFLRDSPMNVAMFASGLGDGVYESFWAVGEGGAAVSLVTDFGLLE